MSTAFPTVEIKVSGNLRRAVTFEGHALVFVQYQGNVCVPSAHVGEVLGYSDNGKTLAKVIHKDWHSEFVPGTHYDVLRGPQLQEFKQRAALLDGSPVSPTTQALTVLYPSGVDLVAQKAGVGVGARLRSYLNDEVFPSLRSVPQPSPPVSARPETAPWWWVDAHSFIARCVATGVLTEREALGRLAPMYREVLGLDIPV